MTTTSLLSRSKKRKKRKIKKSGKVLTKKCKNKKFSKKEENALYKKFKTGKFSLKDNKKTDPDYVLCKKNMKGGASTIRNRKEMPKKTQTQKRSNGPKRLGLQSGAQKPRSSRNVKIGENRTSEIDKEVAFVLFTKMMGDDSDLLIDRATLRRDFEELFKEPSLFLKAFKQNFRTTIENNLTLPLDSSNSFKNINTLVKLMAGVSGSQPKIQTGNHKFFTDTADKVKRKIIEVFFGLSGTGLMKSRSLAVNWLYDLDQELRTYTFQLLTGRMILKAEPYSEIYGEQGKKLSITMDEILYATDNLINPKSPVSTYNFENPQKNTEKFRIDYLSMFIDKNATSLEHMFPVSVDLLLGFGPSRKIRYIWVEVIKQIIEEKNMFTGEGEEVEKEKEKYIDSVIIDWLMCVILLHPLASQYTNAKLKSDNSLISYEDGKFITLSNDDFKFNLLESDWFQKCLVYRPDIVQQNIFSEEYNPVDTEDYKTKREIFRKIYLESILDIVNAFITKYKEIWLRVIFTINLTIQEIFNIDEHTSSLGETGDQEMAEDAAYLARPNNEYQNMNIGNQSNSGYSSENSVNSGYFSGNPQNSGYSSGNPGNSQNPENSVYF